MQAKVEGVFMELKLIDCEQQMLYANIDSQTTEDSLLHPWFTSTIVNNTSTTSRRSLSIIDCL